MSYLYLDTTYDGTIGILSESLEWVDFIKVQGQKASRTLQLETHRLLEKHGLELSEMDAIFTVAGPGFYTGLRLSEGFADVLKFFGIPHYSFYSFEIPILLGFSKGAWVTKAYRGEYFFYEWKDAEEKHTLYSSKDIADIESIDNVFIHSVTAIDEKLISLTQNATDTSSLIQNSPRPVFETVLKNKWIKKSFYFRAPEDEFKVSV